MRYSTLIKQLFIVVKSRWVLQLVQGKIFSLASFEVVSNLKKTVPHIDTIIDVGANSGQFSNVATNLYPKAKLHAFEPIPDLYTKIAKKFKSNTNITTYNLALGNEDGVINFNKNKYGHISSILNISTTNIHYPNQENDLSQIEVQIKKLDALALTSASENKVVLLKLDVQGYELEVLKGAEASLKNIEYIIIEANLEQLYTNQPSFAEMNAYLMGIGFELSGMLDFNLGRSNKYIEVDFLYKKTTTKQ